MTQATNGLREMPRQLLDGWLAPRHDEMYLLASNNDPLGFDFICRSIRRPIADENWKQYV